MDYNPNQTLVPVIASSGATATFAGEIYSQFQSLTGTFSKWTNSNVLEDGDNFAPPPAHLYVPEGYFAKVTSILKVDDWGKITIVPVNSAAGINNITALNMTNEIEPAGVRGGHVRWQKQVPFSCLLVCIISLYGRIMQNIKMSMKRKLLAINLSAKYQ